MRIPARIPGLKLATVLTAVYAAVWISLEGELRQEVALGVAVTLVTAGHLVQNWLGGQTLGRVQGLLLALAIGGLAGGLSGLLTLAFMVLKTGLHAHGPEFTGEEIAWVIDQILWWSAAGLLAGLGVGLLLMELELEQEQEEESS
ncbi:MAG: hypothetical protein L0332_13130 [Chloroflexi bacterium]|nr:hypothetical protein [Chloroflexota bacterium]MCI0648412.1 hypothetical protein [Chloroflexota bacterium]MCI0727648.1 hypothetical protein [Chloroflexota bacterium]